MLISILSIIGPVTSGTVGHISCWQWRALDRLSCQFTVCLVGQWRAYVKAILPVASQFAERCMRVLKKDMETYKYSHERT